MYLLWVIALLWNQVCAVYSVSDMNLKCIIVPLPATAQVAGQQGAYLARLFNRDYCLSCPVPEVIIYFVGFIIT